MEHSGHVLKRCKKIDLHHFRARPVHSLIITTARLASARVLETHPLSQTIANLSRKDKSLVNNKRYALSAHKVLQTPPYLCASHMASALLTNCGLFVVSRRAAPAPARRVGHPPRRPSPALLRRALLCARCASLFSLRRALLRRSAPSLLSFAVVALAVLAASGSSVPLHSATRGSPLPPPFAALPLRSGGLPQAARCPRLPPSFAGCRPPSQNARSRSLGGSAVKVNVCVG